MGLVGLDLVLKRMDVVVNLAEVFFVALANEMFGNLDLV